MWLSIVCLLFRLKGNEFNIYDSLVVSQLLLLNIIITITVIITIIIRIISSFYFGRISITFRRMDESKRPIGYLPEPDLQGLQPLSYEMDRQKISNPQKQERHMNRPAFRRDGNVEARGRGNHSGPHYSVQAPRGLGNRRRIRVNVADWWLHQHWHSTFKWWNILLFVHMKYCWAVGYNLSCPYYAQTIPNIHGY